MSAAKKKTAKKKTATKKTAKKKTATKKTAKKAATKKTATKKTATKKTATKKTATKKAAKKTATKKTAKKTATKKTATKKTAKKTATKKTATKKKKAAPRASATNGSAPGAKSKRAAAPETGGMEVVALPATRLFAAAPSFAAAATLVPTDEHDDDGDDDVDDALDEAVGAAFDSVFEATASDDAAEPGSFVPGDPAEDLAQACAALALEKKAENVVVLRVADLTSYADFFVIAEAPSERQVQAIARNVGEELKKRGKLPMSTDGLEQGNWVIVDYGSVVLHVFLGSARTYYDLDGFWVDAPRVVVDERRGHGALAALR
jgi:ribosome-associated protein